MAGTECMHCICKKEKRTMTELFSHVARIISTDWRCLGRELGVEEHAIRAIEVDYHFVYEQAFQVLQKWFEANGETVATRSALCKALHAIKKTYIADIFCDHIGHEDYKQHDEQTPRNGITRQHSTTTADCLQIYVDVLKWQEKMAQNVNSHEDSESMEPLKALCETITKETVKKMKSILDKITRGQEKTTEGEKKRPASSYEPERTSEVVLGPRLYTFSEGQSKKDFPALKLIVCCESCISRLRFEFEEPSSEKESLTEEERNEIRSPHRPRSEAVCSQSCAYFLHAKPEDSKPSSDETKDSTSDESSKAVCCQSCANFSHAKPEDSKPSCEETKDNTSEERSNM